MAEEEEKKKLCPADHNVSRSALSLDPPILRIAEATGQQIAPERVKPAAATAFKIKLQHTRCGPSGSNPHVIANDRVLSRAVRPLQIGRARCHELSQVK
jgi:hypothetical protein